MPQMNPKYLKVSLKIFKIKFLFNLKRPLKKKKNTKQTQNKNKNNSLGYMRVLQ